MANVDSNTPKRIALIADGRQEEGVAGGVIRPGDLLTRNSSGELIKHATAGGWAEKQFALEDALQGRTIADAYAAAERVTTLLAKPGDVVYAYLSGGEAITLDDFLTSNGDGCLKLASSTDIRLAVPLEAVDASDSNDVDERIKVRII